MKFFVILEILLIAARITVMFFDVVPVAAQTALTWACVVVGVIAAAFIAAELYAKFKGKSKKEN